jgi:hypothetical protein
MHRADAAARDRTRAVSKLVTDRARAQLGAIASRLASAFDPAQASLDSALFGFDSSAYGSVHLKAFRPRVEQPENAGLSS